MLTIRPIILRDANAYVEQHHRHHNMSTNGHKWSLACYDGDRLCGVAIAGKPVSNRRAGRETLTCIHYHLWLILVCYKKSFPRLFNIGVNYSAGIFFTALPGNAKRRGGTSMKNPGYTLMRELMPN